MTPERLGIEAYPYEQPFSGAARSVMATRFQTWEATPCLLNSKELRQCTPYDDTW